MTETMKTNNDGNFYKEIITNSKFYIKWSAS